MTDIKKYTEEQIRGVLDPKAIVKTNVVIQKNYQLMPTSEHWGPDFSVFVFLTI